MRAVRREVAHRHRDVDRLDDDAALPMQHAERVRKPEDVAERRNVAVTAAALEVARD